MNIEDNKIKKAVREYYSDIAQSNTTGCGCSCSDEGTKSIKEISQELGYSVEELNSVPELSNMGLGCGNPLAIASLKPGETVLDLGSGGGFDCFLARAKVGNEGYVIGVDMTPEMVSLARKNAAESGFENVEFRLGEIENLPVKDNSIDIIISNCVINLSPNKERVFEEVYRVLKNGGRLSISDIVITQELPSHIKEDLKFYSGCVSGAATIDYIKEALLKSGFSDITISQKENSKKIVNEWAPENNIDDYITSVTIQAIKRVRNSCC